MLRAYENPTWALHIPMAQRIIHNMRGIFSLFIFLGLSALPLMAEDRNCSPKTWGEPICISQANYDTDVCTAIHTVTRRHGLNTDFFTRLIWQESRFNPNALSPADAMGIAQFIASTAKIRGLKDPFNPAEALDESARYLAYLTRKFGNIGLAAVAYNGGELRARDFIAKTGGLPFETRNYVQIVTGHSAETWRDIPPTNPKLALNGAMPFAEACSALAKGKTYTAFKPLVIPRKAWGVQLASGKTRGRAMAAFSRRAASCRRVIRGEDPSVFYKNSRRRGLKGQYVARFGRDSRASANALCLRLKRSGCACAVFKN